MTLERDCIYLIPPKMNLTVSCGRVVLEVIKKGSRPNQPIDLFFRSLAKEYGKKASAVIFSGTGGDGSKGIIAIHQSGGKVYVQSPASAQFDGMPTNALDSKCVDFVGTPKEIAQNLIKGNFLSLARNQEKKENSRLSNEFQNIFVALEEHFQVDFSKYKVPTINRRIEKRMAELKLYKINDYAQLLAQDSNEVSLLYYELLIGVTKFFRDESAFKILTKKVIPEIVTKAKNEIRIWVPGCASGEEPYSLAILFFEEIEKQKRKISLKIFATDINDHILATAASKIHLSNLLRMWLQR